MKLPPSPSVHLSTVREVFRPGSPGCWVHAEWEARFPWLAQGTTGRGPGGSDRATDFGMFADPPAPGGRNAWGALAESVGFGTAVHSRQVHGMRVLVHSGEATRLQGGIPGPSVVGDPVRRSATPEEEPQVALVGDADGHVTVVPDLLLGVTVADCVPVFLVDPVRKALGILHAGWRGTANGILEEGIQAMTDAFRVRSDDLHVHLGPAICGRCYEVGPEVFEGLGLSVPPAPTPLDLRSVLAARARSKGVGKGRISTSGWCTLCPGSPFFSHRRGDRQREVGFLGIRTEGVKGPAGAGETG